MEWLNKMRNKWDDQSDIVEYIAEIILEEIKSTGESPRLDEILSEHFDKDDIRETYAIEFAEIDRGRK